MPTSKTELTFAARVQKRFITITIMALFCFMIVQILILSNVGTLGPNISKVKNDREKLYVQNEVKSVEIRDLQTQGNIVASVTSDLQMGTVQLQRLEIKADNTNQDNSALALAN